MKKRFNVEYEYTCAQCGELFHRNNKFTKHTKILCNTCKRNEDAKKSVESILNVPRISINKILNKAYKSCILCGWNKTTLDIHHIIPKANGGNNENDNLIIVCPNCHRLLHSKNGPDIKTLERLSIAKTFADWKKYK